MGMKAGGGGGDGTVSDINVTPFVDVCLVLLIIFMVVTPMLQSGVAVELPKALMLDEKPDDERILQIVLDRNLTVYVRETPIGPLHARSTEDDIRRRISLYNRNNPGDLIQIKADKNQRYGQVRKLMLMVQEVGARETTLVADEIEEPTK